MRLPVITDRQLIERLTREACEHLSKPKDQTTSSLRRLCKAFLDTHRDS